MERALTSTATLETSGHVHGHATLEAAARMAEHIRRHDRILVAAHGSPDGDALGATGAVAYMLQTLGKRFTIYNATGIPDYLAWLPLPDMVFTKVASLPFTPELIIALDCGDVWRLGKDLNTIFNNYPSLNIDHHLENPNFGSLDNWVDPNMAATGQMVAAIADALSIPLADNLAKCLYLSLVSDTGSFTHGNTDAAVFTLAARLMAGGLNASAIREQLDNQWSLAKARLWGQLLSNLQLEDEGRIALCVVPQETLAVFGAMREDLEGFAEQMRRIKGVRVGVLLRQDAGNRTKISLRSCGTDDVRQVAALFGGGGHFNAAGATCDQAMPLVAREVLHAIQTLTFGQNKPS